MSDNNTSDSSGGAAPTTAERLAAATIGAVQPLNGQVYLAPYDPNWPAMFAELAGRIRAALGEKVLLLEHTGSTSVPGLRAKPIIDIVFVVKDSADEASYVPAMEARGFTLRIREPDWFEHRMFKGGDIAANVHVFSEGCDEVERVLAFRDRLRASDADRERYERAKVDLAARTWAHVQDYADAKSGVIREILGRTLPTASPAGDVQS